MHGHAITAWVAVCCGDRKRSGVRRDQGRSKRGEASHLFIVLDKATLFVAAARNPKVATQSYAIWVWGRYGMAYCMRGIVCNLVLYLLMEKGRFEKRGEGYPIFILGERN
jgi:hypothetical protein